MELDAGGGGGSFGTVGFRGFTTLGFAGDGDAGWTQCCSDSFDPKMDQNDGYTQIPKNKKEILQRAAAIAAATAAAAGTIAGTLAPAEELIFTFGHGARHLLTTALEKSAVESAIQASILQQLNKDFSPIARGASFWGRIAVDGTLIEFRGFGLGGNIVNIGTYYPIR